MSSASLEHNTFRYSNHRPVLQHLSFSVPQGAFLSFLGPNGLGKPTRHRVFIAGAYIKQNHFSDASVSHDLNLVATFDDRAFFFSSGKVVALCTVSEVLKEFKIFRAGTKV